MNDSKITHMNKIFTLLFACGMLASCSITTPVTATNNRIGSKVGVSSATCLFLSLQHNHFQVVLC